MASELKPCAHCSGAAELDYEQPFCAFPSGKMEKQVAIYCTECDVHMSMCYSDFPEYDHDQMAEILTEKWNTRPAPAAADTGLVRYDLSIFGNGIVEMGGGAYVRADQADELLAAEIRRERDLAAKQISEVVDRMSDDYLALKTELDQAVGVIKDRSSEYEALEADNAAQDAWIKELDRCHEGTIDLCNQKTAQIEALEAKLAAAEKALEPFSDHANDQAVDDTGWRDKETVKIVVSIGDLRKARAVLGGKPS